MYTPQQVSEMLNVPVSTLRRYSADFSAYLSRKARARARKRRYTEEDLLIIRRIRELYGERKNKEEIERLISVIDKGTAPPEGFSLAMIPAFQEQLQQISQSARDIKDTQQEQGRQQEMQGRQLVEIRERTTAQDRAIRILAVLTVLAFLALVVIIVYLVLAQ